ncbi:stearoyl-CoA desaturase (delta-9 desaturase) [Bradyrhizobium sp. AZCC 1610]|uniref:acyl-CoA desaturase n=1 Tax=Bradyrhizobium sp. AZCC 1610 TaxID=3117020 RepID=UPI002FF26B52
MLTALLTVVRKVVTARTVSVDSFFQPVIFEGVKFGGLPAIRKRVENGLLVGIPLLGSFWAGRHIVQHGVTWIDISAFVLFYVLVGLGVALGLHRYFSHKSFETTPAIAFLLGALGSMAFQGSIARWVVDHRRHHAHTDQFGDVHSPLVDEWGSSLSGLQGIWHAHVGWLFDCTTTDVSVYGASVTDNKLIAFFHRTHWIWPAISLAMPYVYGYVLAGPEAAWSAMLIGGCLRTTVLHNVVWGVNSIGHLFGEEAYSQGNGSKNNRILAMLTFGDGWHNNHHRFPRSAFHGLTDGQLDVNGHIITLLEKLGLVWNVIRLPRDRSETPDSIAIGAKHG